MLERCLSVRLMHTPGRAQPAEHQRHPALCRLPAAVVATCLLLTLLLLSQQRLQIQAPCSATVSLEQQGPAWQTSKATGVGSSSGGSGKGDGSSNTGSGSSRRASCEPPKVASSTWADSCQLLRDVCVDQGTIILYGEEHRMTADRPGTAPYSIEPAPDYRKYVFVHRNSVSATPPSRREGEGGERGFICTAAA